VKEYVVSFVHQGVPLEARRLRTGTAPSTKWIFEDFAVYHPSEPGSPIDQIQLYYDTQDDEWKHWPTKFVSSHRPLGKSLAIARNENPELTSYKVTVNVHRHVDLSDKPTTRKIKVEAQNPSEAVYRLRDAISADNVLVLPNGSHRYIGNVWFTRVSQA